MRREILICDNCSRGNDDGVVVTPYRIDKGCEMDPSGNGYNTNWDYVDYCAECYKIAAGNHGIKIKRA